MSKAMHIRMGGYGPPTTGFSLALKRVGDRLEAEFGDDVDVSYVWNIMDLGHRGADILPLVEGGTLTLGYQSSSYFTHKAPELGLVDLPFIFSDRDTARRAMDGELGSFLTRKIEEKFNHKVFGYFENGFRHVSNRVRPVHAPSDMAGLSMRVLPSDIQQRAFELLGASAEQMDLSEAIERITNGTIDAQENPLANTVAYGAHRHHRFHTLTSHCYLSRPIFLHAPSVASWPEDFRQCFQEAVIEAVGFQRGLVVSAEETARQEILDAGCEIVALDEEERIAFAQAVAPLMAEARDTFGPELLNLLPRSPG